MKKFTLLLISVIFISAFTACGKEETVMKPENFNAEITVPDSEWNVLADDKSSYIISKDKDLISCSTIEIPSDNTVKLPSTEEELISSLGEAVAAASKISDFSYEDWPEENTQSLFYLQTIDDGTNVSVIICKDTITGTTRTTYTATLINADENKVKEIRKSIKEM